MRVPRRSRACGSCRTCGRTARAHKVLGEPQTVLHSSHRPSFTVSPTDNGPTPRESPFYPQILRRSPIVTHFDHQDRPWKRLFYDLNGRVERRILMRYDAAGRLVEDGEAEAEGIIREDLRRLYGYDAEGRLIEKTMYYYGLWMYRTTFGYNDQGDIIEERHQHTGGIIQESGERDWKTQSRYQYDDRGNWIERVTENVLGTGDRRLSMIERRRIDYY